MLIIVVALLQDEGKALLEEVLGSNAHLSNTHQEFHRCLPSIGHGKKWEPTRFV
jgi:hypothetical protein